MMVASAFVVGMAAAFADWGRSGRCPCLAQAPRWLLSVEDGAEVLGLDNMPSFALEVIAARALA